MRSEEILTENAIYNPGCECPCCQFERENPEPRNRNERRQYKKSLERIMKKSHFVQRAIWVACDESDVDDECVCDYEDE